MKRVFLFMLLGLLFISCSTTKNVVYFQDAVPDMTIKKDKGEYIKVKPKDMISILVSSKTHELAIVFNLPRLQRRMDNTNTQRGEDLGYTVDSNGNIDFPILGQLHVAGLAREEIAAMIKEKLISQNLIKDPIVTVNFSNLTFSVLGEVARPGQYEIEKDQITILEALSKAGDLTIHGKRDKVFLIRDNATTRITYQIDLRTSDLYYSPAFYVQQNDVIYVEPSLVRANQSTINGNNMRSVSLWMSIASFITSIGVMLFK